MSNLVEKLRIYDAYKAAQKKRRANRHDEQTLSHLNELQCQLEYFKVVTLEKDKEVTCISKKYKNLFGTMEEQNAHICEAFSVLTEQKESLAQRLSESRMEVEEALNRVQALSMSVDNLEAERERLKNIETILSTVSRCGVCLEMIRSPALLSCGHMFCSVCINRWRDVNKPWAYDEELFEKAYPCPTCRVDAVMFRGSDHWLREIFAAVAYTFEEEDGVDVSE